MLKFDENTVRRFLHESVVGIKAVEKRTIYFSVVSVDWQVAVKDVSPDEAAGHIERARDMYKDVILEYFQNCVYARIPEDKTYYIVHFDRR